ncbi:MAG: saccharopine dehydrogenase family protein [Saprospiraceae bacterium]
MINQLMIYGANGYTAQLIIELAVKVGIKPILAGRNKRKIQPIAKRFDLPYRIFDLQNPRAIDDAISDIEVVLHCAGPYIHTAKPMVEACIRNMAHYLDITGEIDVFELIQSYDYEAKKKAVMLLPGCGFDVVPTDCMAKYLSEQLPDATHLSLAFASKGGGLSHGTAMTAIENLGEAGKIRLDGQIVNRPIGHQTKALRFGTEFKSFGVTIPWRDVSTAFYSTEIPNIQVFLGVPQHNAKYIQLQSKFNWLLKMDFVKKIAKAIVNAQMTGPDKKTRQRSKAYVWGEVKNAKGQTKSAYFSTLETYTLTAVMAVRIAQKVLDKNFKIGFQTPSNAYGWRLITEIEETRFGV